MKGVTEWEKREMPWKSSGEKRGEYRERHEKKDTGRTLQKKISGSGR